MSTVSVLFVCLGNICRSPTAEGVFRALCERDGLTEHVFIDSAGTAAYHVGEAPDSRAQAAAMRRNIDLSGLGARQVDAVDFERFDYVLAMDHSNFANLEAICPVAQRDRLKMFLDFAAYATEQEVPDPYFGGDQGFEYVLDLCESASTGLLEDMRRRFALP